MFVAKEATMTVLIRSAYFETYEKGVSGGFVLPDGKRSENFYSKTQAFAALKICLTQKIMDPIEGKIVFQQIEDSSLPEESSFDREVFSFLESLEGLIVDGFIEMKSAILGSDLPEGYENEPSSSSDSSDEETGGTSTVPPGTTLH